MFKIILSVIIGQILYDLLKKGIKIGISIYKIKKNKNNLHKIINNMVEKQDMNKFFDQDFWSDK